MVQFRLIVFARLILQNICSYAAKHPRCVRTAKKHFSAQFSIMLEHGVIPTLQTRVTASKGIKRSRVTGVSDDEYAAVWACAHPTVQDAMDLALCTDQRPADVLKFNVTDIADGSLSLTQNKTGKKLRIAIEGELAEVIDRILSKSRDKVNKALLQDPDGQRLSYFALRSRFDKAREIAGVNFQFRDLRAKVATDTNDLSHAQKLLGHKKRSTTEIYTRDRKGELVKPLTR